MDVDEPLMKEWIVRTDRDAGAYTALPSSIRSYSQTSSMKAKTNAYLRQINAKSAMKVIQKNPLKEIDMTKQNDIMDSLTADRR